ncbi:NAD-dependent epimerase/dehydratase family protein [Cytobacillus sp. IB215665]|uniref:NAD-dependent epimerase/dehydratase family protein n=1 Tax=Cytobacillus sp. IB215665 TaxID=3097357 RepID=UPI002A0F6673|nr:NAD-dependent epimerase/dehydratase family protein [Cytobacillus sp. IB215665]MDX8366664.1 NAD-dependent epimerase/dehydratase family protein [Cytobacillus sp. IB215665]
MKVLVTGGAGFIGSHIVERLVQENYEVTVVDNMSNGDRDNILGHVCLHQVDITSSDLEDVFLTEKPTFVIHQAAQASVPYSMKNPLADSKMNIQGTINLLQCCIKFNVKKIIFASTAAVYGKPHVTPVDESHVLSPKSFYGVSKVCAETYIQLYESMYGLKYCILRYANVYGPRQGMKGEAGVISIFLNKVLENERIEVFGNGNQTRDFIHVKDVANASYLALSGGDNQIMNISTGSQTSINELIDLVAKATNRVIKPVYVTGREGEINNSYLSNSKAQKLLNWYPNFQLEQGIKNTLKYLIKNVGE